MPTLTLDLNGPIAFLFNKGSGNVQAFLPPCLQHTCNILTDNNDISPALKTTFTLNGPVGVSQTQVLKNAGMVVGANLLIVSSSILSAPPPNEQNCYCIFELPIPDSIIGLRTEPANIKLPSGRDLSNNYFRGLRFFYSDCAVGPTITPFNPDGLKDLDARSFEPDGSFNYRIEIRLHDTNPNDPDGGDAKMCSETLRGLFPPLDQWTVDFHNNQQPKTLRPFIQAIGNLRANDGPRGVDCGANGVIFDEGTISGVKFDADGIGSVTG